MTPEAAERERIAAIKFAKVVPVDNAYTVAIGALGVKFYDTREAAEACCDAINQQIAGAIRVPEQEVKIEASMPPLNKFVRIQEPDSMPPEMVGAFCYPLRGFPITKGRK